MSLMFNDVASIPFTIPSFSIIEYYFQQNETSPKVYVNGKVTVKASVEDDYSRGNVLSGTDVPDIIQAHVDAGRLPEDTSAVYFFFSSGDVKESIRPDIAPASFCKEYCGYHVSWPLKSGKRIYYAMVGDASACPRSCHPPPNPQKSPNGDLIVDGMIESFAHELVETVTDPESDISHFSWLSATGENADKCVLTYGVTKKDPSGFYYNVETGGRKYLIPRNWDPELQACAAEA